MKKEEYWQQFMQSGQIADYLSFKGIHFPIEEVGKQEMGDELASNINRSGHPPISGGRQ